MSFKKSTTHTITRQMLVFSIFGFLFFALAVTRIAEPYNGQAKAIHTNYDQEPLAISLCELIKDPNSHDGKLVKLIVSFAVGPESTMLYDLKCNNDKSYIYARVFCDDKKPCEMIQLLEDNSDGDFFWKRSEITVIGIFRVAAPSEKGFGHLSAFRYALDMERIENIKRIPKNVPWPWGNKR